MKVVPEPSERCTTTIGCAGSFTEALSLAIAGSFQVLISPMKILASVGPSRVTSPCLMPSIFTTGTTPPSTVGNWTRPAFCSSSAFSGMSVAPKVTVLAWICLMPPPEPIDW
jgi:hypothetical protein